MGFLDAQSAVWCKKIILIPLYLLLVSSVLAFILTHTLSKESPILLLLDLEDIFITVSFVMSVFLFSHVK